MSKQNELERIERYINGQADNKEIAWVESLFLNGEDNLGLRHLLEKDWDSMHARSSSSEINLDHVLDHIHHTIRKTEYLKKKTLIHEFTRVYMKAAAILLIPMLIAAGLIYKYRGNQFWNTNDPRANSTILAPIGARVSFNLPDGTIGMLNSGSSLCYSLPFTKKRNVTLEGEAWFEVSRDEKHPFEITAGTSKVKVMGTKFNICAYPNERYVEVVLAEGKIVYYNKELSGKVSMYPSERLVFQNGHINHSITDPAKYNAWTQGKLMFKGDPMSEVARRIERWYNVKVELFDKELENYTFRATFEDDKLEDVLKFLSMTSPIKYKILERNLLSDGTYEKEKVIIYLKK